MPMEMAVSHATERAQTFDAEKAIAAIAYLVEQSGADLYAVMKMVYLADRTHLGKFGRTITGDEYTAMEKGPLPERSYNMCKYIRGQRSYFDALPDARSRLRMIGNNFELVSPPDLDVFSKSDLSALNETVSLYRRGQFGAIWKASHDAAWKAAWEKAEARGIGSISMDLDSIAASLPDSAALIEYLEDPHPGEASHEFESAVG